MTRPPLLPEPALAAAAAGRVDTGRAAGRPGRGRAWTPSWRPALAARGGRARRALGRSRTTTAAALTELGRPTVELPFLAGPVDLGGLYELAELLRPAGAAA